jgi:hypothetical protein
VLALVVYPVRTMSIRGAGRAGLSLTSEPYLRGEALSSNISAIAID